MTSSSDGCEIFEIKKALKVWENDFKESQNRKPGRDDMMSAPQNIQDLYSKYNKLKKLQMCGSSINQDDGKRSSHDTSHTRDATINNKKEKSGENLDSSADSTCEDVWGAHLNKTKKNQPKDDNKGTEKKVEQSDAALKMYSKKLFNNSNSYGQMSCGPRQGKSNAKKQSFWSRDETSDPKEFDSDKQASSIHNQSGDHGEPAPVLDFFGTKLSSKSIRLGSCTAGRTTVDTARVVGPRLPKTRIHSLQEDWLKKCEKENEIVPLQDDMDMNEKSKLNDSMEVTGHPVSNGKRCPRKTRRTSVRERADDLEADIIRCSPEKQNPPSQNMHPASDRTDGFTCIVKKKDVSSCPSQADYSSSKETSEKISEQFMESVSRKERATEGSASRNDALDVNDRISEDEPSNQESHSKLHQKEDSLDDIGKSEGHKKRVNVSPSAPPSKRRKTGRKEVSIDDGEEKEEQKMDEGMMMGEDSR
nr:uncharacterized protein LOC129277862 [Lytechinus pictus]